MDGLERIDTEDLACLLGSAGPEECEYEVAQVPSPGAPLPELMGFPADFGAQLFDSILPLEHAAAKAKQQLVATPHALDVLGTPEGDVAIQPTGWEAQFVDLGVPQLRRLLRERGMSEEEVKRIKTFRRRLLNRRYAKTSRGKRSGAVRNLRAAHGDLTASVAELSATVATLQAQLAARDNEMAVLVNLLVQSGQMTREEVEAALAPCTAGEAL